MALTGRGLTSYFIKSLNLNAVGGRGSPPAPSQLEVRKVEFSRLEEVMHEAS